MNIYEMQQYIFNEITKDDVIENEIDEALLDHDCGYETGNEEGCSHTN